MVFSKTTGPDVVSADVSDCGHFFQRQRASACSACAGGAGRKKGVVVFLAQIFPGDLLFVQPSVRCFLKSGGRTKKGGAQGDV